MASFRRRADGGLNARAKRGGQFLSVDHGLDGFFDELAKNDHGMLLKLKIGELYPKRTERGNRGKHRRNRGVARGLVLVILWKRRGPAGSALKKGIDMHVCDEENQLPISEGWDGIHIVKGIYAIEFADRRAAIKLTEGVYDGSTILTRLFCDGATYSVVVKPLFSGLDDQEEALRARQAKSGKNWRVMRTRCPMGDCLRHAMLNPGLEGKAGPFPLNKGVFYAEKPGVGPKSVAAMIAFGKGKCLIEVSVHLQTPGSQPGEEDDLIALAEAAVDLMASRMRDACEIVGERDGDQGVLDGIKAMA